MSLFGDIIIAGVNGIEFSLYFMKIKNKSFENV